MKNQESVIYVNMLGGFSISIGDKAIVDQNNQAKKPWSLLEYLITFRGRDIPVEELIDLFWKDEGSNNPAGALKTLMFRVRKLLEPLGYPTQELIFQNRKAYGWTKHLTTVCDTDRFEDLCVQSEALELTFDQRLSLCMEAFTLYKGNFLPKSEWETWVVPIHTYYHTLYQKLVNRILNMLDEKKDYPTMIEVCQQAIAIDPYGEDGHYYLICALYQSGNQLMAMEHYQRVNDMFYNEFAITPSLRFKELYKLISDKKHGITMDLSNIREILLEGGTTKGAFCCEPSVFRDIYQLETRAIERTGDSIFLCLLTISNLKGELLKPAVQTRAMDELGESIRNSLRRGDIFSRYSVSQYLMLLPTATYENGENVLKRIIQNFKKEYSRKDLSITYSLQSVTPNQA
ncbi:MULTISPECIES: BTAD domain-containing putative transcriptional regulator [Lacrimispora]|jgi:DNA-binding SARP family transcriptional activator|uniref:BTAD domain-containing putative transcriptional regulator n=1 Tax=Lacrimispora TaxID=2719231 RepID=UPI00047DC399|nr:MULTISPECIES: BTAD domain-containing putative transcriptional regulator [Lacrimispora]